jgi:hypothetical protein
MYIELRILVPEKVVRALEEAEIKTGLRKEDIVLRALVRVLRDELGVLGA